MSISDIQVTIDGQQLTVPEGLSVREAALKNGIYVPGLCSHPELDQFKPFNWSEEVWQGGERFEHSTEGNPPLPPPAIAGGVDARGPAVSGGVDARGPAIAGGEGVSPPAVSGGDKRGGSDDGDFPHCDLCLVSIDGGPPERACAIRVADGMQVRTEGQDLVAARRESLKLILEHHPHACLTCAQREGCSRTECSMNVPEEERCCELLGRCELQKVAEYIGIPIDTPPYKPEGRPVVTDEPLFIRDYELCVGCLRCVRICRDVRGVDALGAVASQERVKVGTTGGSALVEALCRFCGACVEVCPTGALRDKPGLEPLIDGQPPCIANCPLGIDIPGYLELVSKGLEYEALELIRERAVLPGVLGYACFHPCEDVCRRCELDDPVSICTLKRYVSDVAGEREPRVTKAEPTGRKVAVVGGGPAGLAAAADLLRMGHKVTIIDSDHLLGGMLRQSIPGFRLPDEVIDRDLRYLFDLGLDVRLGVRLGSDTTPDRLRQEGFDAVVLAVGLAEAAPMNIEGEKLEGIERGLDLLREAKCSGDRKFSAEVVVIGGGSVAVDAAMTARRMGAGQVTMVCLEEPDEMPAARDELDAAIEEGIEIMHRWGVSRFEGQDGEVRQVALKLCTRVFDDQRRFSPEYDTSETMTLSARNIIVAIGQKREDDVVPYLNEEPGLFVAGDVAAGPTSIVEAMADGRRVAEGVNAYLGYPPLTPPQHSGGGIEEEGRGRLGRDPEFHHRARAQPDKVPAEERVATMDVYEATLTRDQALEEAARCLSCHLRALLEQPLLPPDPWRPFEPELAEEVPAAEGVLVLADQSRKTVKIMGAEDIKSALSGLLDDGFEAAFCRWELDPMFTKRESELIQFHLQAFGEMPGGSELDDLF